MRRSTAMVVVLLPAFALTLVRVALTPHGSAPPPPAAAWQALDRLPEGLVHLDRHRALWTGRRLLMWGRPVLDQRFSGVALPAERGPNVVAAYDTTARRWDLLPGGPLSQRAAPMMAWSGHDLFVVGGSYVPDPPVAAPAPAVSPVEPGGPVVVTVPEPQDPYLDDAAAYDLKSGTWRSVAPLPIAARDGAAAVWTGRELLIWGGSVFSATLPSHRSWARDGAAYDPGSDSWRVIEPGPFGELENPTWVWTGRRLLVWQPPKLIGEWEGRPPAQAAAYDPASDTWVPIANGDTLFGHWDGQGTDTFASVWTGTTWWVWWGSGGAEYDPAADGWTPLPRPPLSTVRGAAQAVWTGSEVLLWGGGKFHAGMTYDPAQRRWDVIHDASQHPAVISVNPTERPSDRLGYLCCHSLTWTGAHAVSLGGYIDYPEPDNYFSVQRS